MKKKQIKSTFSNDLYKIIIKLVLDGYEMAPRDTNFNYYYIYLKGNPDVHLTDVLKEEIMLDEREFPEDDKTYYFKVEKKGENQYYGKIIRAKDNSEFSGKLDSDGVWKSLKELYGDGEVSNNVIDISHFLLEIKKKRIYVLSRTGFQLPGILKLTKLFNLNFSEIGMFKYKLLPTRKSREAIKRILLSNNAQRVEMDLKSDIPDLSENEEYGLVSSLKALDFDGFRISLQISLDKRKKGFKDIKEKPINLLKKFFKQNTDDEVLDLLFDNDLPNIFNRIEVFSGSDSNLKTTKNLLNDLEKETLSIIINNFDLSTQQITDLLNKLHTKVEEEENAD